MPAYSPFQKQLHDLDVSDLSMLKEVREGWYIEYKREIPNAASIAKSISAFANTYGGWLFLGVEQESNDNPVAGRFPGIGRKDTDAGLQRLRKAVADHLNPIVHFDIAVVWGDVGASELAEDRAVICVYIPWSANAPHIHSRGMIYRRVGDGSEPKPETDRNVIDQIRNRGERIRSEYATWVARDPDFLGSESRTPFLRLLLVADLWRDRDIWCDLSLNEAKLIMNPRAEELATLSFDNVYTSETGFVARQTVGNNPQQLTLLWRFSHRLRSEILIPINKYEYGGREPLQANLDGFEHHERFSKLLRDQGYEHADVLDLKFLFHILMGIVHTHEKLEHKIDWSESIYAKARLLNVWRTTPFLDMDLVLDQFESSGIPLCLDKKVEIFPGTDPDTFFEVPRFLDIEGGDFFRIACKALTLFGPIAQALGVPSWLEFPDHMNRFFHTELLAAGDRALEAQMRRNERKRIGQQTR